MRWPWFTVEVSGRSMQPTYADGDWLLVIRTSRVRTGDVVVVQRANIGFAIKRVIAVSDNQGDAEFWLEGDNPGESTDSRVWGWVPREQMCGRVVIRFRRASHRTAS